MVKLNNCSWDYDSQGKIIMDNSLVIGNPGQFMRNVTNSEIKTIEDNAMDYIQLSKEFNRKNSP